MSEKYISVETAVALAMQYCPDDDGVCPKAGHDLRELLDDLENAAPADVRPVVYCRDCTWFHDGTNRKCCTNHKGVVITDENGFCHHAKRKNGGADNG